MRRAIALLLVFVVLVAVIGGLGYFQFVFKPDLIKNIIAKAPPPVQTVAVKEATTQQWAPSVRAIGSLRAVQGVDLAPQIGGVITSLYVARGQDVEKGAVIAQLDDSVEQADLQSNQASLKIADITLERQKGLIAGGNTSKATFDQAQATRDTAIAAVARSKAVIAQKKILAPFSGRIGLRKGDVGQFVAAGTSIVNLQQLDPIYVDFPVPEQNLAVIKIGARVSLSVDAYPGRAFDGTVRAIDARVSSETRSVLVRGELANPDKILLPGMFANVSIAAGEPRALTTIPRTAVAYSLYGDNVFVVRPDAPPAGSAQAATSDQTMVVDRRVVQVGDSRGDDVAILDGVSPGDKVIVEGQIKLQPGMRVKVDNASALPPPPSPRSKE